MQDSDMTDEDNQSLSQEAQQQGLYIWTPKLLLEATKMGNGSWHGLESTRSEATKSDFQSFTATRIITDTRKLEAGDIFLAIVGEKFDAHDFLETAQQNGAVAAIVSQVNPAIKLPQLKVDDTRLALGHIAAYRRQQHPDLRIIALTGSSGKTTVKEMLRGIFKQLEVSEQEQQASITNHHMPNNAMTEGAQSTDEVLVTTLVTRGNLNNDFGVPMMLLELEQQHRYAVLELGANHVGEIAYTANIVKPDVACILNIGTAHLGEFGGRDNIATTKAEIYQPLSSTGVAVVPADDDYAAQLSQAANNHTQHVLKFGWHGVLANSSYGDAKSPLPNIYATEVVSTATDSRFVLNIADDAQIPIHLPLPGAHNVSNALAAAACAYALGLSPEVIATGLSQAQSSKGRLKRHSLGRHQVIDDTYNANPNSVRAAADVLAAQTGFKVLVLGDIGELGDASRTEHQQLGVAIAGKAIDMLLCVGEFASDTVQGAHNAGMSETHSFSNKQDLLVQLMTLLDEKDKQEQSCSLLFKGSRSMTMETLIDALI